MGKNKYLIAETCFGLIFIVLASGLHAPVDASDVQKISQNKNISNQGKLVIYQVLPRLFGNKTTKRKPWGTIKENGVGKFKDFSDQALAGIKEFGVSHIWFTGVLHHAVITDYTQYGISNDDPDVVKGRAGSPYAVKDYYNVDPDLAVDPAKRLQEFKQLIDRTHRAGMKVIIDIVPNHIARNYYSLSNPQGVVNFGEKDDPRIEYKRNNNFYYIVGEPFKVPITEEGYQPLNGEEHPLADQKFNENPAKWTGNGSRKAQPKSSDWYETVKINYGVKPDGSYDFETLPLSYRNKGIQQHFNYWQKKNIPDSWRKFHDIALYWIDMGVDGFRYDMAEMVPVEFWSYLNSSIKTKKPSAVLVAEVYNPEIYRDYIALGKMDYLYDKVDFYDSLKAIMRAEQSSSKLLEIIEKYSDIEQNLLHFLENHDEQRIASRGFVGDANKGKPAMVVSSLMTRSPTLLFYAQALGEPATQNAGFGKATRTTIFDYWSIPSLQRWMNNGKFDGGQLTGQERELRQFYVDLLSFSASSSAMKGKFADLHRFNLKATKNYTEKVFSFARWSAAERVIVVSNFSDNKSMQFDLRIPHSLIKTWQLKQTDYSLNNILQKQRPTNERLVVTSSQASIQLTLAPLESKVFLLNPLEK